MNASGHALIMASALVNGTASPDVTGVNNENLNPARQLAKSPAGGKSVDVGRKGSHTPSDTGAR